MKINIPYQIRAVLYIITAVGTPIIAYLLSKGIIGALEVTLWSAQVVVISGIAAFNVTPDIKG